MSAAGAIMWQRAVEEVVLEKLDWEPACEFPRCHMGHPAATHIQFFFLDVINCNCFPESRLICSDCATWLLNKPDGPMKYCSYCGTVFAAYRGDYTKIEPLP